MLCFYENINILLSSILFPCLSFVLRKHGFHFLFLFYSLFSEYAVYSLRFTLFLFSILALMSLKLSIGCFFFSVLIFRKCFLYFPFIFHYFFFLYSNLYFYYYKLKKTYVLFCFYYLSRHLDFPFIHSVCLSFVVFTNIRSTLLSLLPSKVYIQLTTYFSYLTLLLFCFFP